MALTKAHNRMIEGAPVNVRDYGAVGDGVTDDTDAINAAIAAASPSGKVILSSNKTYIVRGINPPSDFHLDFNGSTLKSKDLAHNPIFFDPVGGKSGFILENAKMDCNMANNAINVTGGVWLTDWNDIQLLGKTEIYNCYREGINLYNCKNVVADSYEFYNSGLSTGPTSNAGYGLTLNSNASGDCSRVYFRNIYIHDVIGFGIHLLGASHVTLDNVVIANMRAPSSIGITYTYADNVSINNMSIDGVNGDAHEINASTNISVNNLKISNTGGRGLIFGDNGSGGFNENVVLKNVKLSSIGTTHLAGSHIKKVELHNLYTTDALFSLGLSISDSTNTKLYLNNCKIPFGVIKRPYVKVKDCYVTDYDMYASKLTTVIELEKRFYLGTSDSFTFPLYNNLPLTSGRIEAFVYFTASASQCSTISKLYMYDGSSISLSAGDVLTGAVNRQLTYTMSSNSGLIATNNSGTPLHCAVNLTQYI